jgi:MtN3 and saliva related transmembrane protein
MSLQSFCTLEFLSGSVALVTSIIGLFPQVYKSYQTKSTDDISMIMLINYLVCSLAWIVHGVYTDSKFVIYSNIIGSILSGISIAQKTIYDRKNSRKQISV